MHSLPEDLGGNLFSLFPEWRLIKGDTLPVEEEELNADTWTDLKLTLVYQMVMDVCWAGGHIDPGRAELQHTNAHGNHGGKELPLEKHKPDT